MMVLLVTVSTALVILTGANQKGYCIQITFLYNLMILKSIIYFHSQNFMNNLYIHIQLTKHTESPAIIVSSVLGRSNNKSMNS